MKVLIVEPGKYPREADIEHTLEAEQTVVGGTIEAVYPWRDSACIVCNDNGIAENLPLNRILGNYDIIHGTFFVCGLTRDDFTDLTPQQMKHYEEMYHDPQLFFLLGKVYDAFWMSLQRISELLYGQILAAMATDGILYIVICLMSRRLCNILPGIAAIAGQVVMATLWARCANSWYFRTYPPQPTAVVYDVRHGLEKLINEYGLSKKYDVKMTLNVEECLNDLSLLDGMQSVFISGVHSHERNIILKYCVEQGINVFVIPRVGDVIMSGAQPMHMFHLPMLRVGRYMASPEYLFVKRLMDIVVSLAGLVILSPLLLTTAIAVKSDGGPAFYKQVRLTKDGRQFEILKFRSMRVDAEKDGVARLSTGDKDDRITKVGHIIRACRLDELPQLWNILRGDLSIVGPRPERPEIAAQYCEEMPEFALRLQAKAGLTGYAQVYGKYNTTPYDKLQMDLMYIAHPSLIEDLKIMLATVKILFMPESTEGISEGQTTAMSGENN